ncbi:nSTAND1 domain-containing NTPase [Nocardia beijingensis]|uniref:nSTAND1 domain-containing NTPase n=1 Tax=Nocardia beijingensis TaxID=95162 RepID=UPI0033B104F9
MKSRSDLVPDLFSILVGTLLGMATNLATSDDNLPTFVHEAAPLWAFGALLASALLLIGVRVWRHFSESRWERVRLKAGESPYPGLDAFSESEAGAFFGRDRDIRRLLDRVQGEQADLLRCIAIVGPSGSGKSSLVQAGLVPRLTARRGRWVVLPRVVPGPEPLRSLARALVEGGLDGSVGAVERELSRDTDHLRDCLERLRAKAAHRSPQLLLVVDQAEELVTARSEDEERRYLTMIERVLRTCPWACVILVFRSEFLTHFLSGPHAELFEHPVPVAVLPTSALHEVIERPADAAGVRFDPPDLVRQMVGETGSGEALPLLAWTLMELWERKGARTVITEADYQASGGVLGALSARANSVTEDLVRRGAVEDRILDTLLRFFHLEGSSFTRRQVNDATLSPDDRRIVAAFVQARLLSADSGPQSDGVFYQVTHEALIRHWAPLRQLAETRRAGLEQLSRLERWARDWAESERADEFLLAGARLEAALGWWADAGADAQAVPTVEEFLQRSTRADRVTAERLADASAVVASEWIMREPDTAIMVALAAEREYAPTPETRQVLVAALCATRLHRVTRLASAAVRQVAWAPGSQLIAAALADGAVMLYDRAGSQETVSWPVGASGACSVAWSADGAWLASGGADGVVRVWDVAAGSEVACWSEHAGAVHAVAWSPDGARLASGGADGVVRVWDVAAGSEVACWSEHAGAVHAVAWSPDGARLASGGADRTVRLWDVAGATATEVLSGHEAAVLDLDWNPSGDRLASGSSDWIVRIWAPRERALDELFVAHDAATVAVAWSRDGDRLATCSEDRTLKIWSVRPYRAVITQRSQDQATTSVSWAPDDSQVVTGSADGTLRVWSSAVTQLQHDRLTRAVAWAADGRRLASAAFDGSVKLWDVRTGRELTTFLGHESEAVHLHWSPSGGLLASTSRDQTIRIWDSASGGCRSVLRGHSGVGTWVSWSPGGDRLATASRDRTVRLWDMSAAESAPTVLTFADGVTATDWSRDGGRLVVALLDRTVRVLDVAGQREILTLDGHHDEVWTAAWSTDGTRIATGCFDGYLRIWDAVTAELLASISIGDDAVQAVAWSPREPGWIAGATRSGTIRLWSVDDQRSLAVVRGHKQPVWGLHWRRDGEQLATSSDDGEIRIWNFGRDLDSVPAVANAMGLRELTVDERHRFLLPARQANGQPAASP